VDVFKVRSVAVTALREGLLELCFFPAPATLLARPQKLTGTALREGRNTRVTEA